MLASNNHSLHGPAACMLARCCVRPDIQQQICCWALASSLPTADLTMIPPSAELMISAHEPAILRLVGLAELPPEKRKHPIPLLQHSPLHDHAA